MRIYYYREGNDMDISDNDETGLLSEFIEVPDELGNKWLAAYKTWADMLPEIWSRVQ